MLAAKYAGEEEEGLPLTPPFIHTQTTLPGQDQEVAGQRQAWKPFSGLKISLSFLAPIDERRSKTAGGVKRDEGRKGLRRACTGWMGWMAHRKWKESKQEPSMLPGPAVPGSCLICFHFLWAIHPIRPVQSVQSTNPLSQGVANQPFWQICVWVATKNAVIGPLIKGRSLQL